MLTHRQIDIFRTLILTQSVTATAEVLFTSQPTISRELARMEQLLEFSLFERKAGKIQATEAAFMLYQEVQKSFTGLQHIISTAQKLKHMQNGQLSLCAQPFLNDRFIPQILHSFMATHPHIQICLNSLESPYIESDLSMQKFHAGWIESAHAPAGTETLLVMQTNEVCILPKGHALLKKDKLSLTDFHQQNFIALAATDPYRQLMEQQMSQANLHYAQRVETPRVESICSLVRLGLGISIINPLTALEHGHELEWRPLDFELPFHLMMVRPVHRPLSPLIYEFADHACGYLQQIQLQLHAQGVRADLHKSCTG